MGGALENDDWVRRVLGVAVSRNGIADASTKARAPTSSVDISPVKLAKAAMAWRRSWAQSNNDIDKLREVISSFVYEDEDIGPDQYGAIEARLDLLQQTTDRLNLSLADELDDLLNTPTEDRAGIVAKLHKRLDEYQHYLDTDEVVDLLGDNEFLPVPVKANFTLGIAAIREALPI